MSLDDPDMFELGLVRMLTRDDLHRLMLPWVLMPTDCITCTNQETSYVIESEHGEPIAQVFASDDDATRWERKASRDLFMAAADMRETSLALYDRIDKLQTRVAEIERELAAARAIIAGRPTPPSRAEEALHRRRRGSWLVFTPTPAGWRETDFPDIVAKQWSDDPRVRYVALDAERRFTAWPTVTP